MRSGQDIPCRINFTRSGENDTGFIMFHCVHTGGDKVIVNQVIIQEQDEVLPASFLQAKISIVHWTDILFLSVVSYSRVAKFLHNRFSIVRRTIVRNNDLNVLECLTHGAAQRIFQITICSVVCRDAYRDCRRYRM